MSEEMPEVEQILEKIKSRGYWQVIIRPLKYEEERLGTLSNCAELVQHCRVRLRGWDYPHVSRHGITSGTDYVESLTDWERYKELWRMYLSGQFFHLFGLREDWWGPVRIFWSERRETIPGYGLSILSTLYTITEIYEFAARLVQRDVFGDALNLSIMLNKMKDRRLVTLKIERSLSDSYICHVNSIPLERTMTVEEILGKSNEYAVDDTFRIFEIFNWFRVPKEMLREEQKRFLEGRLK
jgi:hypothetical protein